MSAAARGGPGVLGTTWAFVRLEAREDFSYPLTVGLEQLAIVFPVLIQYFVAKLVPPGRPNVGGDYFTFAVIGMATAAVLLAALSGFGRRLQRAQDQGTFETLLVEPVPWTLIPFVMNTWKIAMGFIAGGVMLTMGGLLGADYRLAGIPSFLLVVALGVTACVAIGILSASLMVLAKRSAPVLSLYGLAASLLGGALFPPDLLPTWLRWLSHAVPHMYTISHARSALMQDPAASLVGTGDALLALGAFSVVVMAVGLPLFSRSLQYARRMGLLSGY